MFSEGYHQSGKVARMPMVLALLKWDVKLVSYNNFGGGSGEVSGESNARNSRTVLRSASFCCYV